MDVDAHGIILILAEDESHIDGKKIKKIGSYPQKVV